VNPQIQRRFNDCEVMAAEVMAVEVMAVEVMAVEVMAVEVMAVKVKAFFWPRQRRAAFASD
jgi:hypothetical protein